MEYIICNIVFVSNFANCLWINCIPPHSKPCLSTCYIWRSTQTHTHTHTKLEVVKKCWAFSSGYNFGYGTEEEKPMTLSLCTSRDFLPEDGQWRDAEGGRAWKCGSNFASQSLFSFCFPIPVLFFWRTYNMFDSKDFVLLIVTTLVASIYQFCAGGMDKGTRRSKKEWIIRGRKQGTSPSIRW